MQNCQYFFMFNPFQCKCSPLLEAEKIISGRPRSRPQHQYNDAASNYLHHHDTTHQHEHHHHEQDKMAEQKKVTWDELVYVRRFEAHAEELKVTYPRPYPYRHGSRQGHQKHGDFVPDQEWLHEGHRNGWSQGQQPSFQTSATFDL